MVHWTEEDLKKGGYDKSGNKVKQVKQPQFKPEKGQDFIFIPYQVMSSKNSKQIWWKKGAMTNTNMKALMKGKPVIPYITDSDHVKAYKKQTAIYYQTMVMDFRKLLLGKKTPYLIEFTFIRESKQKWDYLNIAQVVQDMMQKHGWLQGDDITQMKPVFGDYQINKENPGVRIKVL